MIRPHSRLPIPFPLLLGLLLGCPTEYTGGGKPGGGDDDDTGGDDDDTGDDDTSGHEGLDLSGTWAQRFCQNEHYDTALGSDDGTRVTVARIEIDHVGTTLHETSEACAVWIPPMGEIQVTFPDALVHAIPPIETSRPLAANEVGAVYENQADPLIQLIAWHPDGDPATEPIPTDASDPRVFDMDNDGYPGGTALIVVSVLEGEMYVVARTLVRVDGTVVSAEEISGSVDALSEQVTLGASHAMFEQSADVTQMPGSTFKKVKIDPGLNCDAIEAQVNDLFGPCPTFP